MAIPQVNVRSMDNMVNTDFIFASGKLVIIESAKFCARI